LTKFSTDSGDFCPFSKQVRVSTDGPPDAFPFGGGRRACIGKPLTFHELHTIFARVLETFELVAIKEEGTLYVERNPEAQTEPNNFVSLRPGHHYIAFVPRSEKAKL
jgi:hypothetical protein